METMAYCPETDILVIFVLAKTSTGAQPDSQHLQPLFLDKSGAAQAQRGE